MSRPTVLHCMNCWWSTPPGNITHCRRCGQPLHLPDARRVVDVVAVAAHEASSYAAAGYDPRQSVALGEVAALVAAPPRGARNWVTVVRCVVVLQSVLITIGLACFVLWLRNQHGADLSSTGIADTGSAVFLYVIALAAFTAFVVWLMQFVVWRLITLLTVAAAIIVTVANPGHAVSVRVELIPVVFADVAYNTVFAVTLITSIVKRPPKRRPE